MLTGSLLWLELLGSTVVGAACLAVAARMIVALGRRRPMTRVQRGWATGVALFMLAFGGIQLTEVAVYWQPLSDLHGAVKAMEAALALIAAVVVWLNIQQLMPDWLLPLIEKRQTPASNRQAWTNHALRARVGELNQELAQTEAQIGQAVQSQVAEKLDAQVSVRTQGMRLMQRRFEDALSAASVVVYNQDRDLRYTFVSGPGLYGEPEHYLGKTDYELLDPATMGPEIALKQRALASGRPQEGDVMARINGRAVWQRLHVQPTFRQLAAADDTEQRHGSTGAARDVATGITSVAVDITLMKALEEEQIRLNAELAASLQRTQLALQSSKVIVFTQDRDLVYTSLSKGLFNQPPEEFLGQADEDILPAQTANVLIPLKQKVLQSGQPAQLEVPLHYEGQMMWLDLYINPLKDVGGRTIGLTCAALDITERKGWEEHLRLLMREVTHRSKNLLAVIQAMARQTARGADSVDNFVERFSARLQALGGAHDLLVRESWHGVNMPDLVRSQLGHYADLVGSQITMDGPDVYMTPEAAQNLGMALHEMATNAAKYGALSKSGGQVGITWEWQTHADPTGTPVAEATKAAPKSKKTKVDEPAPESTARYLHLCWQEKGGPAAKAPEKTGFGTHVIQRNLVRSLSAKVDLEYGKSGFQAEITIPGTALMTRSLAGHSSAAASTIPAV